MRPLVQRGNCSVSWGLGLIVEEEHLGSLSFYFNSCFSELGPPHVAQAGLEFVTSFASASWDY